MPSCQQMRHAVELHRMAVAGLETVLQIVDYYWPHSSVHQSGDRCSLCCCNTKAGILQGIRMSKS